MDNKVVLIDKKEDCCGCGACVNICPRQAIYMKEDEYGFTYPVIDESKCIQCGLCKKACNYKENKSYMSETKLVYAAASKEDAVLEVAASGGIFSVLAKKILLYGGIVYGVAMEYEEEQFAPKHIEISDISELWKLQGSKYVQSEIGNIHKEVKENLLKDKVVLFSGTPCQVAGLRSYLGKDYDKLITVDVICHGVPNKKFFNSYIEVLEKKLGGKVKGYKFRDKSLGQGMHTRVDYCDKKGNQRRYITDGYLTSYFYMFLKSYIYRENCYSCPYAQKERVSDITIGDYWGVYKVHASEIEKSSMSDDKGISCILVNTNKGKKMLEEVSSELHMFASTFEKVAAYNAQLKSPSPKNEERDRIMEVFKRDGYEAVDVYYKNRYRKERLYYKIKSMIPRSIKKKIKGQ